MSTVDAFAALRVPFVRAFALARLMSFGGQVILSIAVGWELYERTGSAWSLGLVGAFELAPVLLLMVVAGNAADRYPRRNIVMLAHGILVLASAGLATIAWTNGPVDAIYFMLVLVGVARAFSSPSFGTILPQLLKPEQFINANAWVSSAGQFAAVAGPALGGMIIAASGGAGWAFVAVGFSQLSVILALLRLPAIPPPQHDPESRRSPGQIYAGFGFIRRNPLFLSAITLDLFAVLLGGAVALLPIYAKDILAIGPAGLGWLRTAPSIGSLATALAVTHLPPWRHPGRAMLIAVAGFGLATIGFGLSHNMILSLVCLFLTGACDSISVVVRVTLEQVITPDRLRGRVSAINYVFIGFSNEFGMVRAGATAAIFGPVASVVGGGIGSLLVVAIVALAWPQLPRVGPLHTLKPVEEPA
ncbi:MAG: MFS transporter [Rhodospirillaceae bacterium]|nr:MAG: MFS transporter [Rhodospirillaceae bacterium]